MADEELFQGGVHQVRRVGGTVIRPAGRHSDSVHRLLRHVCEREPGIVPAPLAIDRTANTETLSFLAGETTGYPLDPAFATDLALVSAARLLRSLHDATEDFVVVDSDLWDLPSRAPADVICHGDFAPYNCVVNNGLVTGVFDFDTAHPGHRLWDLGYAAYRWVPLTAPSNPVGSLDPQGQDRRLRLFCQSYGGAEPVSRVVEAAAERLSALVEMMVERAAAGNEAFAGHIAAGHDRLYRNDIEFLLAYGD